MMRMLRYAAAALAVLLPLELRETALGGLATCPSVCSGCGAS